MHETLDTEILKSLRELNTPTEPTFLKDFMMLFLSTVPARIAAISNACETKNAKKILQESHALKSSCLSVGANRMTTVCDELEQNGINNKLENVDQLFAQLNIAYDTTKTAILALPELKSHSI